MSHRVGGLIARAEPLGAFARESGLHAPAPLAQGFAFLPLDAEHVDALCERLPATDAEGADDFRCLTPAFMGVLFGLTRLGAFAYVETDYFGGAGDQGALVVENGVAVLSPERGRIGPISRALTRLGVARGAQEDEFDALGLGAWRRNEDWIDAAR